MQKNPLQAAIGLMTDNCFMGSIDWKKDAYYSVAIDKHDRKFLCSLGKESFTNLLVSQMG